MYDIVDHPVKDSLSGIAHWLNGPNVPYRINRLAVSGKSMKTISTS